MINYAKMFYLKFEGQIIFNTSKLVGKVTFEDEIHDESERLFSSSIGRSKKFVNNKNNSTAIFKNPSTKAHLHMFKNTPKVCKGEQTS